MKKLLASDYDGTLKTNLENLYINIKAINKFREYGNKFAIVTGRSYLSIKKEICKYNIEYDYLSCNNGLVIFDNKDNIINANKIPLDSLEVINDILTNETNINEIFLYDTYDQAYTINDIIEVYVNLKNVKTAKKIKNLIEDELENINCYNFKNHLFIGENKNKSNAVSFIQNLENIDLSNVYTVGDDLNDIEMLENFNGYKMSNSNIKLFFKNIPTTKEVHKLIKKLY